MTHRATPRVARRATLRATPAGILATTLIIAGCATPLETPSDDGVRVGDGPRADAGDERAFDRPGAALEFHAAQRLAPGIDDYPMEHLRDVLADVRAREQAAGAGVATATWSALGPGNVGGRSRTVVFDPSNPDTMYAAGVAGGVWKSTDAGASWHGLDDFMLNLAVTTLAIDPADPDVLYAGTGEGYLAGTNATYTRGLGIFKTTDAGATWTQLAETSSPAFHYVNKVVVSPNDSSRLYAATRYGVWRSLDAGATWSVVLSNPVYSDVPPFTNGCAIGCTDLKVRDDRDPDVLWAAFGSFDADGVFRSDDGGDTWIPYSVPANQGRMTFALAPSDNDIVYILMADNGTGGATGQFVQVFRSLDGGATFEARTDLGTPFGPWLLSNLMLATGCRPGATYSQGWHDNIIKVDPSDPDTVWVGGVDLFRSDDGGINWGLGGYWIFYQEDPAPPYQIHPDHHEIVFHPDYDGGANQTMFVANDGGLFRTDNARAATTQDDCPFPVDDPPAIVWARANNGYQVTQFYHGDSARGADVFVAGAQDNGTSRATSRDAPDDWRIIFGGDGGYAAVDPFDDDTMYVTYQFFPNIMKSVDGGETFIRVTAGITDTDGLFITPLEIDQNVPGVLWTGGRRPWRTQNGAATWELAGPDLPGADRISAIAIAPSDSNVVYLGFQNGYVARSTNALAPAPAWTVFANGLYGAWVSSLAVDPDDPDRAYVTYSTFGVPHVLRTNTGGQSWHPIDGIEQEGVPDIPGHWVAVRPCDPQQLFVGTELGVFTSPDGGGTWAPANDGLAHTIVETLDWKNQRTLVAFTHGRGAFLVTLPPCASCPGDVNGDGVADFSDLLRVLAAWGPCDGSCAEDLDGSGDVGFPDLLLVLSSWGSCP